FAGFGVAPRGAVEIVGVDPAGAFAAVAVLARNQEDAAEVLAAGLRLAGSIRHERHRFDPAALAHRDAAAGTPGPAEAPVGVDELFLLDIELPDPWEQRPFLLALRFAPARVGIFATLDADPQIFREGGARDESEAFEIVLR